eukprot:6671990-Karenia_brevis.AAC.1
MEEERSDCEQRGSSLRGNSDGKDGPPAGKTPYSTGVLVTMGKEAKELDQEAPADHTACQP